jgi:hypothetical protein
LDNQLFIPGMSRFSLATGFAHAECDFPFHGGNFLHLKIRDFETLETETL